MCSVGSNPVAKEQMPSKLRGSRNKKRSTRGRRLHPYERIALAKNCKHTRFRYRNRSKEAVCLDCGSVQYVKLGPGHTPEATSPWHLEDLPDPEK